MLASCRLGKRLYPHVWSVSVALLICLSCLAASVPGQDHNQDPGFPLDPLTGAEITLAVKVLRESGKVTPASRFPSIVLREPPKSEVLAFHPGQPFRREAAAVVYERESNRTYEAVVDLRTQHLVSWKEEHGVEPPFLVEDFLLVQSIVHADPAWQEAMLKRGIKDFASVQIDGWSAGYYGLPGETDVRVVRALSYYRGKSKNPYAHPIEGVVAYVDLNKKRVFRLIDTGVVPVPRQAQDLDDRSVGNLREAPKPLEMVQKDGPSFQVTGSEVRWQNWDFRFALHPREGLVLYTAGYEDNGKLRPVLYRASLSEMVVPYGDPAPTWFFRNAFDEGEYGIGRLAQPLEPGIDAPNNAVFFDGVFGGDSGAPIVVPRAAALYERDGGILWKHVDYLTGHNESRRARELVLCYVANVGNYEYAFNWVFHQDGSLEMEVDLTGIMQAKAVDPKIEREGHSSGHYGHLTAPGIEAVHHQHFLNFRLDMDVDGAGHNSVVELNTNAVPPGPRNPHQNAIETASTLFHGELEARRDVNMATSRKWIVVNDSVTNGLGQPVGYMLIPGENSIPYAAPGSSVRKRAGFISHHLWVTRYDDAEMDAAGYYINQSKGGEGLPKWTSANRPIDNQDVVIWYTMGITHIPRPEEWPVMTVHKAGFMLVPCGFFDRNPALAIPDSPASGTQR